MPKRRHRFVPDQTLLAIIIIFLLEGLLALGFLKDLSKENRALIVIASSVGIFNGFAGSIFISLFSKRLFVGARRIYERSYKVGRT